MWSYAIRFNVEELRTDKIIEIIMFYIQNVNRYKI